jgi:hypothetical protein
MCLHVLVVDRSNVHSGPCQGNEGISGYFCFVEKRLFCFENLVWNFYYLLGSLYYYGWLSINRWNTLWKQHVKRTAGYFVLIFWPEKKNCWGLWSSFSLVIRWEIESLEYLNHHVVLTWATQGTLGFFCHHSFVIWMYQTELGMYHFFGSFWCILAGAVYSNSRGMHMADTKKSRSVMASEITFAKRSTDLLISIHISTKEPKI